ncbi:polysaccharide deacetylase family protein [Marinoscillum sp. 108]|uniref:polysaccharide deacetylase family protein n=1 Tax=Marinoscillum sp. 108 TaxID=2653151 RepID=UPI0012F21B1C|nr:polysaccharide deacetylase family protein [Marinoscillum sp. 108]VXD16438.1 Polysaccharide deacetylase [Marinoscillum sp. 108]
MRNYFFQNPFWISWLYPGAVWKVMTNKKELFLTFDDGPHPVVTPYVLAQLRTYQAKATFFCLGSAMEANQEVVKQINDDGHLIGNHTQSHLNGWATKTYQYMADVLACQTLQDEYSNDRLFRPPYGNLKLGQLRALKKAGYRIIMWSHLSGDFDRELDRKQSLDYMKKADPGSILVFHDSEKAFKNLKEMLPRVLEHFSTLGYSFKTLSNL